MNWPLKITPAFVSLLLAILGLLTPHASAAGAPDSRILSGSVRLPDAGGQTIGRARIVRATLTADEMAAPLSFSVTLQMRDFAGLQARVAEGGRVGPGEMESTYLPLRGDYERLAAWLSGQGFNPTLVDNSHTTVFVRGTVAQAARSFGLQFARVAVSDGEYTSAVSEPVLPADLAGVVLSVNGLQPQFRLRHVKAAAVQPRDLVAGFIYVTPDNVVSAYNIPGSATGAGQIIAIVGEAPVMASDLTSFWSAVGVAQTAANVTTINVDGGPGANPSSGNLQEADLDVQWAGALAPAAQIRLYLSSDVFETFTQIGNDVPAQPNMRVVSVSFGDTEGSEGNNTLMAFSQVFASFAASGVSVLAASGDGGSNPSSGIGGYSASAPLAVTYPASDPNVTGVGGTTVEYTGNWAYAGDVVWNELASTQSGTGGGVSTFFAKPAWQTGGAVLAGQTMRCVPDVAAISNGNLNNVTLGGNFEPANGPDGVVIYVNGSPMSFEGTSLSCPVWAAITALVNQARAAAGTGSIGLLNPYLYPLAGTSVFNDVTSGTNGAYNAGPGYDLCSGLGTPNVTNLLAALGSPGGAAPSHRLVNLSTRADVETGANIAIAGFDISGPAGTSKDVLVRGVGPTLAGAPFNVGGTLGQPVLGVYDSSSTLIATDAGWGNAPTAGTSTSGASFRKATAADMSAVGAFALNAGSADSAMVLTLPPGTYTVQVSGAAAATGVALAEVYELSTASPEMLVNISARCFVGTGSDVAISGFVVQGSQSAQLLIRGVGPALAAFSISGPLAQPVISLFDSNNTLIVSDAGWSNNPVAGSSSSAATYRKATAADMTAAGAFGLTAGSADSAIVATLPPGSYTAQISGAGNTTGTALAEVYELPSN